MTPSETVSNSAASAGNDNSPVVASLRSRAAIVVVAVMEAVLLVLVCLSPWAYGAVHPGFEFLLDAGIAVLLALWGARMLLEGRIAWKRSPVAFCLAGLFLLGLWQRAPLPRPLLARLSPGIVRCYDRLLPERAETLADNDSSSRAGPPPGSTLSLYPGATRRETMRLLSVLLVFAVVYNNLTASAALVRLSGVVLINGVLLSLFALVQFFAAPRNTLYWHFPSKGNVFGPFINRNHFPDYVNVCIGLGIGLLVRQQYRASANRRHASSSAFGEQGGSLTRTLRSPLALGICTALGLMVSAVAFSRSRGGLLALVGAAVICGVLGRLRLGRSFRLGGLLLVAGVVVALSAWFGIGLVKDRLGTLVTGEAFESRVPLWLRSLPIVADFPVWGTGYGTFGYVEPMYRTDGHLVEKPIWYGHAHNDYLEILVEGGAVGLSLALLLLLLVFRGGYLALGIHRGRSNAGLVVGALFAFTALVLHGFSEFGVHIPAITLLAVVVCAHLCALGQSSAPEGSTEAEPNEYRLRFRGIAPLFGAITLVAFGLMLCAAGWTAHRVDRLQESAFRAGDADAGQLRTRIACFAAAVSLARDDAQLHYELGFAHAQLAERATDSTDQATRAVREYLRARDACPLLNTTHLGLAAYATQMRRGDAAEDYLRRVKLLAPGQAELWYLCGVRESLLGRPEDAWATWRHCLELSDDYLVSILNQTADLAADKLVDNVLPDSPDLLVSAALRLYPGAEAVPERRLFLEKALRLLDGQEGKLGARQLHVKALAHRGLDRAEGAVQAYRQLLNREPSQLDWRFEFARYLRELGKLEESRRELMVILAQDPNRGAAQALFTMVDRELSHEKWGRTEN